MDFSSLLGGGGGEGIKSSAKSDTSISASRTLLANNSALYVIAGLVAFVVLVFVMLRK